MPRFKHEDLLMFYKVVGNGEPLLLIHGLGSDHRGWEFQEEALAAHFQLIIPDLRGHGQTEVDELGMMIPAAVFADDLAALLQHLKHPKVHVVGHSLGGIVAQSFVLRYPDRVRKLVLMGTTPKVTDDLIDVVYGWREVQVEGGQEAYFWTSLRSGFSDEWIENNPDIVQHLKELSEEANEEGIVAAGLGLASTDFTGRLGEIKAETMIIHGDEDRIIKPEMGVLLHQGIQGSVMKVFKKCGHSPTVQEQDRLNGVLIEFFKDE
ncbi:MAG: alpha/beta fold hydrolase [Candidatus Thorarchaeota archaeon]|nr:alpha/beta fold hydrolase [Candidatus Thorarchaeota archaeon]